MFFKEVNVPVLKLSPIDQIGTLGGPEISQRVDETDLSGGCIHEESAAAE
jgi:hypothetical protein